MCLKIGILKYIVSRRAKLGQGSARPEVRGTAEPTWRSLSPMKSAPSYVLTSIILTKRGPTGRDR